MEHIFIVNPIAGGSDKSQRIKQLAAEAFSNTNEQYSIYVTRAPKDATVKVSELAASGKEYRVYACGGDGTFNECVSGAVNAGNISVCPFPIGTGNDFCRMFGEEQKLFHDINSVIHGSVHPIDMIRCNDRYSVNICSAGIDARIGCNVHKYTKLPLIGGSSAYVFSAIVEMLKGIGRHVVITSGDYHFDNKCTLICVCNGRFYGGGFNPSTDAIPDDAILEILVVEKVSLFKFAALIKRYAKGEAVQMKEVTFLRADNIIIEFDDENIINLDGESLITKKAEISLLPKALNLIVPDGISFWKKS